MRIAEAHHPHSCLCNPKHLTPRAHAQ